MNAQDILTIVTCLVTAAAGISAVFKDDRASRPMVQVMRFVNLLALNVGKAKNR